MTLRAVTVQEFDREMSAVEHGRLTIQYHLFLHPGDNDNYYSSPDYVPELLRTFDELPEAEKEGYQERLRVLKTGREGLGI
jgi:hypothetical protein